MYALRTISHIRRASILSSLRTPLFQSYSLRFYSSSNNDASSSDSTTKAATPSEPVSRSAGTIHDDSLILGSPSNTRNYGKIREDTDVSRALDALPLAPVFDTEDQTGMDYNERVKAKRAKIDQMFPGDADAKHEAFLIAHNQVIEEMKTELIREFQFDPVEHKKFQDHQKMTLVSTTAYKVSGIDSTQKGDDTAAREDTSGGFSFGSINYTASVTTDSEIAEEKKAADENQRTYVVGSHGKKLLIPKKEDIMVVERPLDSK